MIQGQLTYSDGMIYNGGFADGKRSGEGLLLMPDGSKYEGIILVNWKGFFLNDFYDGEGALTKFDESVVTGEWKNGELIIEKKNN